MVLANIPKIKEGSATVYLPRFVGEYSAHGLPCFIPKAEETSNTDLAKFEEMGQYIPCL